MGLRQQPACFNCPRPPVVLRLSTNINDICLDLAGSGHTQGASCALGLDAPGLQVQVYRDRGQLGQAGGLSHRCLRLAGHQEMPVYYPVEATMIGPHDVFAPYGVVLPARVCGQ